MSLKQTKKTVAKSAEKRVMGVTPIVKSTKKRKMAKLANTLDEKISIQYKQDRSEHVVNLKNPNQDLFTEKIAQKKLLNSGQSAGTFALVRPPRVYRRKNKTIDIDLLGKSKRFSFRSFFSLFQKKRNPKILAQPTQAVNQSSGFNYHYGSGVEDIFAKPNYIQFLVLHIPRDWPKKLAVFGLVSIIFVLPLQAFTYYQDLQETKGRILLATNEAIENLKNGEKAVSNLDLTNASSEFALAQSNFVLAKNEINALNALTSELIKLFPSQSKSVEAGLALLEAGEIVAQTGQILIDAGQNFLGGDNLNNYFDSLSKFDLDIRLAINNFQIAKDKIINIDPKALPEDRREDFNKVISDLPKIESGLKNILILNGALLQFLGDDQWQRYMVVFLNNNELRGGGGFMGSFALMDIDRGEIKNLTIPGGGTYDIQGQLVPRVIAPEPLHLINTRWEFQDSNWWPDFPSSAKKMQWFHENAGGPSVDGVITITASLMSDLIDIFGPFDMPEYGKTITGDNFIAEAQNYSANEYDKEENQPKKLIGDLAPKIIDRVFNANEQQLLQLFDVLKNGLNQKHFLVNFNNEDLQQVVSSFGWDGKLKNTEGDFLSVVHTNLAGGKTDGVIQETIKHVAEIQSDGRIVNTVRLIRYHTGVPGQDEFTGVQNNSYVRFYVPQGSVLLGATGFKKPADNLFDEPEDDYELDLDLISIESQHVLDKETGTDVYKENGKTVFGNWLQLKAGEVQEVQIKYELPLKLKSEGDSNFYYSMLAQKQHGSLGSDFTSTLQLNDELTVLSKFPADLSSDDGGVNFTKKLITDQFYGVVLVKK